jgi:hypothetical protein
VSRELLFRGIELMNHESFAKVVLSLLAALLGVWNSPVNAQDPIKERKVDHSETIAALEAIDVGVRRWRDALNLKCTFRFRQGLANSIDDAVDGRFTDGCDVATCRFVKMGEAVLYDFQIEGEPEYNDKTKVSTYSSFLLASANNVEAYSAKLSPMSPLVFSDLRNERKSGLVHRKIGMTGISPFVLMGANEGALFQHVINSNLWTFSTTRDRGQLIVSCNSSVGLGKTYVVDTSGLYPILLSIKGHDGNAMTIASDFIELQNGCLFPSRFVVTTGPVIPIGSHDQRWVSRIWEIEGLEVSEPTRDDFAINLNSKVKFSGVDTQQKRPDNFLDVTVDTLSPQPSNQSQADTLDEQFLSNERNANFSVNIVGSDWNSYFVWIGICVVVLGGFLFFAAKNLLRN